MYTKKLFLTFSVFLASCAPPPTLDQLILRPKIEIETTPLDYGYDYTETTLNITEDRNIVVWHIPSQESKALILIMPGSDANKGRYCEALPLLVDSGYDVILMDYEGFGSSPGTPSLSKAADDADIAAKYAITLHSKVFIFGVSLGTPLAAKAASEIDLSGCIFEGSLILKEESKLWLQDNDINVPFFWMLSDLYVYPQTPEAYDILKYIKLVDEPKLFMHSIEDDVTPFSGGLKVFEAAPEPKEFWEMYGTHGLMIRLETELYKSKVTEFINSNL